MYNTTVPVPLGCLIPEDAIILTYLSFDHFKLRHFLPILIVSCNTQHTGQGHHFCHTYMKFSAAWRGPDCVEENELYLCKKRCKNADVAFFSTSFNTEAIPIKNII